MARTGRVRRSPGGSGPAVFPVLVLAALTGWPALAAGERSLVCLSGPDRVGLPVSAPDHRGVFRGKTGTAYVLAGISGSAEAVAGLRAPRFAAYPAGPQNRWGLVPAWVTTGSGAAEHLVQARLLREGAGLFKPGEVTAPCDRALREIENQARRDGRGLWSRPPVYATFRPDRMKTAAGSYVLAEGRIVSLGKTRDTRYLNFGRYWKSDFTVLLPSALVPALDDHLARSGLSLNALAGQAVQVRGVVQLRDGPYMELNNPRQLVVLGKAERTP